MTTCSERNGVARSIALAACGQDVLHIVTTTSVARRCFEAASDIAFVQFGLNVTAHNLKIHLIGRAGSVTFQAAESRATYEKSHERSHGSPSVPPEQS